MRNSSLAVVLSLLVLPALAMAQAKPAKAPGKAPAAAAPADGEADGASPLESPDVAPAEEEVEDDSLAGQIDDDPNAPEAVTDESLSERKIKAKEPPKPRYTRETFPLEFAQRPLTMPARMVEVRFDTRFVAAPYMDFVLASRYGLTQDLELGLTWGAAFFDLDPSKFELGKSLSLDGAYTIVRERISVRASLEFNVDPFASGLRIDAPVRFPIAKSWFVYGGHELLRIRLSAFPPTPNNPALSFARSASDALGGVASRGDLALRFGAMYQRNAKLTFFGEMGFVFYDFRSDDQPVPLYLGLNYSSKASWDLGFRAGWERLDELADAFGAQLTLAWRK